MTEVALWFDLILVTGRAFEAPAASDERVLA